MFSKSLLSALAPQKRQSSFGVSGLLVASIICGALATGYAHSDPASLRVSPDERPDFAQDQNRTSAEKLVAEAEKLAAENTAVARKQALGKLQEALPLWRAAADPNGEARTLKEIARIYQATSDAREALQAAERALQLYQRLSDRAGESEVLIRIGSIHYDTEDPTKALDYLNRAVEILKQVPDQRLEGAALETLGNAYDAVGEPRRALEFLTRSLAIRRAIGDRAGEASALANIGSVHQNLREPQAALENFTLALPFFRATKDVQSEAIVLNDMAVAWSDLGEIPKALEYYRQSLAARRAAGDRRGEGITLANIGANYYKLGDNERALAQYSEALDLFRNLQDPIGEARALERIAIIHNNTGEAQKALEVYNHLLELHRARKDKRSEGTVLFRMGVAYQAMKDSTRALDYWKQSLAIARVVENPGDEAEILQRMGAVYRASGKLDESAAAFEQALGIYRKSAKDREPIALYGSARTELLRGNLETARKEIERAIELTESLRGKFSSPDLRISILADRKKHYETYVDVLMRLHEREPDRKYDALALQVHELARARGLLDLLNESRADIRQGCDPILLDREHALQKQLNDKELFRMGLLRGSGKEKQLAEVDEELSGLLSQLKDAQAEIRSVSPQYAALTQPGSLGLDEIQHKVLDSDTVLLEYALGDNRSYMWFVTENSIATFVLPARDEIEKDARSFYESLSVPPVELAARNRAGGARTAGQSSDNDAAMSLGKTLLGPVAASLGNKRLLVVSDGALQYLPFGALHDPQSGDSSAAGGPATNRMPGGYHPLILDHEIVNMPSASALALLRTETAGRKPATKAVAVLADPVFGRDDPRLANASRTGPAPKAVESSGAVPAVNRSARDAGLGDFSRLRFTRQEAESIASLAPRESSLQALDFSASREMATSPELREYRIVHFATHGLLDSKRPELSGLVLSLVDRQGQDVDGFLRFYEIYNLKLNADLVVLSACQTAFGKEIKGEGIMGLTRGFMYAGVPRVVASLWRVDDRATAELMKRFYKGMLKDGLRPAAAMRAAQASMLKEQRWSAPHDWAGFTIQGEWR